MVQERKSSKKNTNEGLQKQCYYGNRCDKIFCKNIHEDEIGPECLDIDANKKKDLKNDISWNKVSTNLRAKVHAPQETFATEPEYCTLRDTCPKVNCPFLHNKKACGI